jgi:hypothetical protein
MASGVDFSGHSACSNDSIALGLALIPDACGCRRRDMRCLMESGIFTGACKSHVNNLLRCESSNPQMVALRAMTVSADFASVHYEQVSSESVVQRIHLDIWLPIVGILTFALVVVSSYALLRRAQYKRRIESLNAQVGGRSTGFSVVAGVSAAQDEDVHRE